MESSQYKQYIVVNKGLHMSPGKMAVQVSHASMAFLSSMIQEAPKKKVSDAFVTVTFGIPSNIYNNWLAGIFTKVCLEAKNEARMERTVRELEEAGFIEGIDFFKIVDAGLTEFDGVPTWTCIGTRPLDASDPMVKEVFHRLQVYRDN